MKTCFGSFIIKFTQLRSKTDFIRKSFAFVRKSQQLGFSSQKPEALFYYLVFFPQLECEHSYSFQEQQIVEVLTVVLCLYHFHIVEYVQPINAHRLGHKGSVETFTLKPAFDLNFGDLKVQHIFLPKSFQINHYSFGRPIPL